MHVLIQRRHPDLVPERVDALWLEKRPHDSSLVILDNDGCAEDLVLILHHLHSIRDKSEMPRIRFAPADGFVEQSNALVTKRLLRVCVLEEKPRGVSSILADEASTGPAKLANDISKATGDSPVRLQQPFQDFRCRRYLPLYEAPGKGRTVGSVPAAIEFVPKGFVGFKLAADFYHSRLVLVHHTQKFCTQLVVECDRRQRTATCRR